MTQPPSDTSDMQRFDEMFLHLTPRGAVTPYSVCYDTENNIWVATKGGLFKFDGEKRTTLFEHKNPFPKKMAAFSQVHCYKDTIVYSFAEDSEKSTEVRFYSFDGTLKYEQLVDGLFFSMVISSSGDIYVSKQPQKEDSTIYKSHMDTPVSWEPLATLQGEAYQTLCLVDNNTLMASVAERPVSMYSKQRIALINTETGEIKKSFGTAGKEGDQIFFPRTILNYKEDVVIMDKTGRFMQFTKDGQFVALLAQIDAYLGNGFCIKDDKALMSLSGVVLDRNGRTIVDDWLEWINLDGSSWKQQRDAQKHAS